jgi:hypothetical protein
LKRRLSAALSFSWFLSPDVCLPLPANGKAAGTRWDSTAGWLSIVDSTISWFSAWVGPEPLS